LCAVKKHIEHPPARDHRDDSGRQITDTLKGTGRLKVWYNSACSQALSYRYSGASILHYETYRRVDCQVRMADPGDPGAPVALP
jgi:hypothetical protein